MSLPSRSALALIVGVSFATAACGGGEDPVDRPDAGSTNAAPVVADASVVTEEDTAFDGSLTATDADGDVVSYALVVGPAHGVITLQSAGGFTYTPNRDYAGPDSFTFVASDGVDASNNGRISITITPVNDPPVVTGQAPVVADEDVALAVSLDLLIIADPDSAPEGHTIQLLPPAGVEYVIDEEGRVVPPADYSGPLDVQLTVTDAEGAVSEPFTLSVTVVAVDDPPTLVAADPPIETLEDVAFRLDGENVELFDVDSLDVTFTVVDGAGYTHDGANLVTPAENFHGELEVKVVLDDGVNTVPATVRVRVLPVDDPPVITGLVSALVAGEETPLTLSVSDFVVVDPDTASESLVLLVVDGEGYSVDPDGRTLTPEVGLTGSFAASVTVSDATSTSAPFSFTVTLVYVNKPPKIIGQHAITLDEDTPYQVRPADFEATDADHTFPDEHTVTLLPGDGYTVDPDDLSGSTFIPTQDFNGQLIVYGQLHDPADGAAHFELAVTVTAINDPPAVNPDHPPLEVDEDHSLVVTLADLDVVDVDDESYPVGFTLTLLDDDTDNHYTLAGEPLAVVPDPDFSGELLLTVSVSDPHGASVVALIPVLVHAIDDPPVLSSLADATIGEDGVYGPVPFVVTDVDTAVENLVVTATSGNTILVPNANVVVAGADRTLIVTPSLDQSGTALITVSVFDGTTQVTESFLLTVGADNDAPTIEFVADLVLDEDSSTEVNVTIDDVDTPVELLVLSAASSDTVLLPSSNLVVGGAGAMRTLRITPSPDQSGSAIVTLTVSDGSLSSVVQFTVTVTEVNDVPTLSSLADVVTEEDTPIGPLGIVVGDLDGSPDALVLSAASSNATLLPFENIVFGGSGADRTITLTPAANQHGTSTVLVTVSDGLAVATESFTLTVNAVDDAPGISSLADVAIDEDTATGPIGFTVTDVDTDPAALEVTATSSDQALVPNASLSLAGSGASRTLNAMPALNRFGTTLITVSVSDGPRTVTESFTLTVRSVNDLPTVTAPGDRTIDEDSTTGALSFVVSDVETASAQLTLTASSSDTTLVPVSNIAIQRAGDTVTVTPVPDRNGQTTITLTVTDADGGTSSASFVLTVTAVNDLPTISAIGDVTILEDGATSPLAFTVGDVETSAASLSVTASSGNQTLVPTANVTLGGSGANRTVKVTPAANRFGSATVTVRVSDGVGEATTSFTVNVTAVNDPPTVEGQKLLKTHLETPLALSIGDLTVTDNPGVPGEENAPFSLEVLNGLNYTFSGNTITPVAGFLGTLTVNVRVTDSGASPASTTSTMSVIVYDYIKDDVFTTAGNTLITGMNFRANDPRPDLVIDSFTSETDPPGGLVIDEGNGHFKAEPPVGLGRSHFTFTYTVKDADGFTDTATVKVFTTDLVWYVNSAMTTAGKGTYSEPFMHLAPAATASNTGHVGQTIYVYTGWYGWGDSLTNGQKLIGQGVAFSPTPNPAAPADFIAAGTPPSLSVALTLTGGAGPFEVAGLNFVNSSGSAITADLSNADLTVRKVNISQHSGRGLSVTNGGKLTVTDLAISSPDNFSGHGIFVSNMSGKVSFTGLNSVTSHGGSSLHVDGASAFESTFWSMSSSGGPNGIVVANTSGYVDVGSNVTTASPTGTGLLLSNVGTTELPFTFIVGNKFTHTGGERGVDVKNHVNGSIRLGKVAAAAGSGVNISGVTAQGIRLNRATDVRLNGLSITNSGDDGLQIVDAAEAGGAPTVNGLSITNATLTNTGNALGEWGLDLGSGAPSTAQVTGNVVLTNVTITRPGDGGLRLENAAGVIASATPIKIDTLTVQDGGEDGHGVLLRASGTAQMIVEVLKPTVTHTHASRMNYSGDGINAAVTGFLGAQLDLVVSNGVFRNTAFGTFPSRGDNAIRLEADGQNTHLTFDVAGNVIEGWTGHSISVDVGGSGSGVFAEGFVRDNDIGLSSRLLSGSEVGNGISVLFDGDTNLSSGATLEAKIDVSGNIIHNAGLGGVQVRGRDASALAQRLDVILKDNEVFGTGVVYGYDVRTLASTPVNRMTLCAEMKDNAFTGTTTSGFATRVGVTSGATFLLPGFAGGDASVAIAYLSDQGNPGPVSATAASGASFTAGTCSAPTTR